LEQDLVIQATVQPEQCGWGRYWSKQKRLATIRLLVETKNFPSCAVTENMPPSTT